MFQVWTGVGQVPLVGQEEYATSQDGWILKQAIWQIIFVIGILRFHRGLIEKF